MEDVDVINYKESQLIFESFLKKHCRDELVAIVHSENEHEHFAIHINALELFDTNMLISTQLLNMPMHLIPVFEQAALTVQKEFCHGYEPDPSDPNFTLSVKQNCHVRISNLPICPELTRDRLPKCQDVGSLLAMTGTVIRCTVTKLLEYERQYICNKCRHTFSVHAEFEQKYQLSKPTTCPSPEGCTSVKFTNLAADQNNRPARCKDYQELKIQEQIQRLDVGNIPRSIWVVLEDDLVDKCKPGDDVTVSGVVLRRWQNVYQDTKCEIELVIKASDVVISNDQRSVVTMTDQLKRDFTSYWDRYQHSPLEGRNRILSAFCPQVFGLYVVKLAVSLALIGGVQRIKESGTRIRGESHLLLVGDPGTGKSQFLKYAAKLMPRSVLTTGIGSTSAGLTVTAVKDSGEWQLEAGALVLADGGICCIDEFNSIREHDRTSIHEAMEQQTISVAKAGLVCKLNTRTTILAATNPKGRYDKNESIMVNTALASPLLSRFDIVLVLIDNQNAEWDEIIADFILRKKRPYDDNSEREFWTMERMQSYFSYVRMKNPVLSEDSMRILQKYYQLQRATDLRNAARTTIRLLESVIRIAEAHSRLMFRDDVTIQDAVVAVCIMESSMQNTSLFEGLFNPLYSAFPEEADEEYFEQAKVVLTKLNLPDILKTVALEGERRKEMKRMGMFQKRVPGNLVSNQSQDSNRGNYQSPDNNRGNDQSPDNDGGNDQSPDSNRANDRSPDGRNQLQVNRDNIHPHFDDIEENRVKNHAHHSHFNSDNSVNSSIDLNIERLFTEPQITNDNEAKMSNGAYQTLEHSNLMDNNHTVKDMNIYKPPDQNQETGRSLIDIFDLDDDDDNEDDNVEEEIRKTKPSKSRIIDSKPKIEQNKHPLFCIIQSPPDFEDLPEFEDDDEIENFQTTCAGKSLKDRIESNTTVTGKASLFNIVQTTPELDELPNLGDTEIENFQQCGKQPLKDQLISSRQMTNASKKNLTSIVQTPPVMGEDFLDFEYDEDDVCDDTSRNIFAKENEKNHKPDIKNYFSSNSVVIHSRMAVNCSENVANRSENPMNRLKSAVNYSNSIINCSGSAVVSRSTTTSSSTDEAYADTSRIGTDERNAQMENYSASFLGSSIFKKNNKSFTNDTTYVEHDPKRRKLETSGISMPRILDNSRKLSDSQLLKEAAGVITQPPDNGMSQSPIVMIKSQTVDGEDRTKKRFKFRKK